jgi:hypothetical protein
VLGDLSMVLGIEHAHIGYVRLIVVTLLGYVWARAAKPRTACTAYCPVIFQLRPDALHEDGLVVAVRKHAAAVAARAGFEVRVHTSADRLPLDERVESELFRVVQEAVHNSVKHAHRATSRSSCTDRPTPIGRWSSRLLTTASASIRSTGIRDTWA